MTSTHTEQAMLDGGPSGDAGYGRVSPKGLTPATAPSCTWKASPSVSTASRR